MLFSILFSQKNENLDKKAQKLAQKFIIVDGHVDLPYALQKQWRNISKTQEKLNFDYVKAKKGGLDAPFMSIYVSTKYQKIGEGSKSKKNVGGAFEEANKLIDIVEKIVSEHPDKFQIAKTVADVRKNKENGIISLPMGMENGAPVEENLEKLHKLYERGIRYITLTHSRWNHIGDSSYDKVKHWKGLSPFGKKMLEEMNKLGIIIDVSHISDDTFYDVMKISKAPAIASHSSVRKFTPGWERNMSDNMIKELAKKNGVIMINFGSTFTSSKSRKFQRYFWNRNNFLADSLKKQFSVNNLENIDQKELEKAKKEIVEWAKNNIFASVNDVADHIDYVVKLVGIDHVGLGSDFDGLGDSLPCCLKDASMIPNLFKVLLERGYSDEDIKKIAGENILRVWKNVEKVAKSLK